MGKRSQRQRRQVRRPRSCCGSPAGCLQLATHEVVDPIFGGSFRACDEHWPDLVSVIWSEGGSVTGCPCSECIHQGVTS